MNKEERKNYQREYRKSSVAKKYLKKYNKSKNHRYCDMKRRCKKKGYDIAPFEDIQHLINSICYYCGEASQGLDRIDNSVGYTKDNVLPCCGRCNKTRGEDWTVEEAKAMILLGLKMRAEKTST